MATIPTPVTQLPMPVPTTQDPANFDVRADAFLGALPTWGDQLNALGVVTYNNAVVSEASATDAAASKDAAAASQAAALASQSAAANSATDAAASKDAAAASQAAALASQSAAANSATDAAASKDAAAASKDAAANSAADAQGYRDEAEVFARTQIVGNSTTSVTISVGSKTFTIEANKAFSIGQYVVAASKANPNDRMEGRVTAYNATTGALTVDVDAISGSGTKADWTFALSAESPDSNSMSVVSISTNTNAVSGVFYIISNNAILSVPTSSSLPPSFRFGFTCVGGVGGGGIVDFKDNRVNGFLAEQLILVSARESAIVSNSGITSKGFLEI